jgi:hypothetical protein
MRDQENEDLFFPSDIINNIRYERIPKNPPNNVLLYI